jgi:hypothetical protein
VASTTSTRLWRTCKAANRPFPTLSQDDVTDYLITEAVALKVARLDREAQENAAKDAEMRQKKKETQRKLHDMFN